MVYGLNHKPKTLGFNFFLAKICPLTDTTYQECVQRLRITMGQTREEGLHIGLDKALVSSEC